MTNQIFCLAFFVLIACLLKTDSDATIVRATLDECARNRLKRYTYLLHFRGGRLPGFVGGAAWDNRTVMRGNQRTTDNICGALTSCCRVIDDRCAAVFEQGKRVTIKSALNVRRVVRNRKRSRIRRQKHREAFAQRATAWDYAQHITRLFHHADQAEIEEW